MFSYHYVSTRDLHKSDGFTVKLLSDLNRCRVGLQHFYRRLKDLCQSSQLKGGKMINEVK